MVEFIWEVDNDYSESGGWGHAEWCNPDQQSTCYVSYPIFTFPASWEVTCRIDGYVISKNGREDTTDKAKQKCIEEYHKIKMAKLITFEDKLPSVGSFYVSKGFYLYHTNMNFCILEILDKKIHNLPYDVFDVLYENGKIDIVIWTEFVRNKYERL